MLISDKNNDDSKVESPLAGEITSEPVKNADGNTATEVPSEASSATQDASAPNGNAGNASGNPVASEKENPSAQGDSLASANANPFGVLLNNGKGGPLADGLMAAGQGDNSFSLLSMGGAGLPSLDPSGDAQPKKSDEGSVAMEMLHSLFVGDENEQKADKGFFETARDAISGKEKGQGLFSAMDATLHGLTPDDIQFANEVDAALSRRPRFGARALSVSVAVMFACLLVWAAFAYIDEVTHAEGSVVGSQRTQTIQNLEGGILRSVQVHEGQIVNKGDVLAQLDNEFAESAYRDAVNKVMENSMAIIRLEAELKGEEPVFPKGLQSWAAQLIGTKINANVVERATQIMKDQENAWVSRQQQLKADIDVLNAQYTQRVRDVEEQTAHKIQLDKSLEISIQQRDAVKGLVERRNFSRIEFLGMEQKIVELEGQIAMLAASIPKAQSAAEESKQRIASRMGEQNSAISEEINKRRLELASLRETLAAGGDRVTRTELRTPVRGTVKQIHINTVGGVVKPGEPIMDIVPLDDTLLVEARVSPKDVAFLRPGQDVMVKVSAYDFSIYGGLDGKLESISADTIEDKRGDYYYLVKVRTQKTSISYHNEVLPIIPGMIVTADIMIGKKTVLDYLLKPIMKAKQNALRER